VSATARHAPAALFSLLRAAGAVENHVDARLASIGLSLPKLAALDRLVAAGGQLSLGLLAERLACVKSNVTQLVDRLESDGLVARTSDPADGRARLAVITDAGRTRHTEGMDLQRSAERELFGQLTEGESLQLVDILTKLERR